MDAAEPKLCWYRLTPDRLIVGLLAVEAFLLLSQWGGWFSFNRHKGWAVLFAVAAVAATLLLLLLWLAAGLLFRQRFQYGLRSLFLLATGAAVACSWLAVEMQRASKQHQRVEHLQALGVLATYDNGCFPPMSRTPGCPEWLQRALGKDFFSDVYGLGTNTENGLLGLNEGLQTFPRIHWLVIRNVRLDDLELTRLEGLDELTLLDLTGTNATDAVLEEIRCLRHLAMLGLARTRITDAGLAQIRSLSELQILDLGRTAVTDAGLAQIQKLDQLEYLILTEINITDAGLTHLKSMKRLKTLVLTNDLTITADGVNDLQRALPNCAIDHSFGTTLHTGFD